MTDTTLLYVGIFCFAMMVLGLGLTVLEFRKLSRSRGQRQTHRTPAIPETRLETARAG